MPRYAYVNGAYLPHKEASVHIEDRGFQFADGVYEVIACIHGHLADERGHLDRLKRSLSEVGMKMPLPEETLRFIIRELLRRNRLQNAIVYMQVTRGSARRDFAFPAENTLQSLILTTWPFHYDNLPKMEKGVSVITVPDIRWKRRDIKTVALLPQVLAKQKAIEKGVHEAWMLDDEGYITEGSASNAWILTKEGLLLTRKADNDILRGVTRTAISKICMDLKIEMVEQSFTPAQSYEASEAFMSSASAVITPIVTIDGHNIGTGKPGDVTLRICEEYRAYVEGLRGQQLRWSA